ncbi:mitochondrial ribosomal subunit protein-domain-containing protein [Leucosporidium creatinivorum]|uniref:Mitochondrial ribosomal subunit protein-domain-containing protein n=1 Tax=Leucosporidium creatinivorum TaxID=106004 RepID=A0A1Y2EL33_9BASI|nr:mitochondrial ribosomal subunit protein-domain-containing protein [Leucosporidium creatinivorum]
MASARRLFSSSSALAARPRGPPSRGAKDPLDITNMLAPGQQFDFPLTRPTLLKMEKRRDFLHYLRLEHLQFKDLVAFRQRFLKPLPSQIIKVRHQHYQGEEHPASRKVSIEVSVAKLPLSTDAARHKFKLLAGPRWNSQTDELKIACEMYPSAKMNEKWCSDTLDKLIKEAENTTDPMTDIPLDTRPTLSKLRKSGSKRSSSLKNFPKEWLGASPSPSSPSAPSPSAQDLPSAGVGKQGGAELPTQKP